MDRKLITSPGMISSQQALQLISTELRFTQSEISLNDALGKFLAEPIFTDQDLPPYDRVMMDGIAVKLEPSKQQYQISGAAAAGTPQQIGPMEVMTGACLPQDCNTVIPYEDIELQSTMATLTKKAITGQYIHPRSSDYKKGALVLAPGHKLSSAHLSLIASVGKNSVKVRSLGKVAIISTGDELVPIDTRPQDHQIRRSNPTALKAQLKALATNEIDLHHIGDNQNDLYNLLNQYLERYTTLIISGGVSKGKLDFIPKVLADLKVKQIFHGVAQKPGKPLWFGKGSKGQNVLALPGNPISSLVCLTKYVTNSTPIFAKLSCDITFEKEFTYFPTIKIEHDNRGQLWATPTGKGNSGDLHSLAESHGFLELPPRPSEFKRGQAFPFFSWEAYA